MKCRLVQFIGNLVISSHLEVLPNRAINQDCSTQSRFEVEVALIEQQEWRQQARPWWPHVQPACYGSPLYFHYLPPAWPIVICILFTQQTSQFLSEHSSLRPEEKGRPPPPTWDLRSSFSSQDRTEYLCSYGSCIEALSPTRYYITK